MRRRSRWPTTRPTGSAARGSRGGWVFAEDLERARRVADRIESGMVFINRPALPRPELPFGGIKRSGYGRELGDPGMWEFANFMLVLVVGPDARVSGFSGWIRRSPAHEFEEGGVFAAGLALLVEEREVAAVED